MLVERHRKKPSIEIPTASLADIAFLLLIFFIVITKFGTDKGIDLTLPPEGAIKEIPKANILQITLDDGGALKLDGDRMSIANLEKIVTEKVLANDRLIVTVKTTRLTPYRTFMTVLDHLKKSGARKISVLEPES